MHDIDRTQLEASWETGDFEGGDYEFEGMSAAGTPFNEMDEMELASQLLEVTDEAELDQFLGSLFKKASRAVGSFLKGPRGQAVGRPDQAAGQTGVADGRRSAWVVYSYSGRWHGLRRAGWLGCREYVRDGT